MESTNDTLRERYSDVHHGEMVSTYKVTTGSVIEALGGIGVIVLGILGLVGVIPPILAPIAAIAFGVALAAEGSSVASRYSQLVRFDNGVIEKAQLGGGAGAEVMGGLAGIVLGILALIGIAPTVLVSAAVVTFGASLLLGAGTAARLTAMIASFDRAAASESLAASAGAQVLVGIGAITLGILALTGTLPMTLNLVGLLVLGAGAAIEGAAVGGSMMAVVH